MSERAALAVAAAAVVGAHHPVALPLLAALALVAVAVRRRFLPLLCLAVAVLVGTLAERSLAGLDGVDEAVVTAQVVLITDPEPSFGDVRAEARAGGRRVELRASGAVADELAPRLAGEAVSVRGRLHPAASDWLVSRHIGASLHVDVIEGWHKGDLGSRVANGLRRTIHGGAGSLTGAQRSLFTGLVYGDVRDQPLAVSDAFLGAGLTHLVAVSGQNVAFCLALAGPALRRMRLWPRWMATLAVIGLFGVMTRFDASVTRASAMAVLAATLTTVGRPAARVRVVALAVTGLLVIDPLLARAVGFQLSVAAALAIVVGSAPIAAALPGPAALREALGVTVAAQIGVAPVLLATFGPMPVATLPANVLAVPVAGLVMVWGLTGGLLAGVLGGSSAMVLHRPTALAVDWLLLVAERSSSAPLGTLHLGHTVAATAGLGLAVLGRRRGWAQGWTRAGMAVAGLALTVAVVAAHAPPSLRSAPAVGIQRWHGGGAEVVVLGDGGRRAPSASTVLEALRTDGVRAIDLLVVADRAVGAPVVEAVLDAHPVGRVVAHGSVPADQLPAEAELVPPEGAELQLGRLRVLIVVAPERLVVDARPVR
ncbi:MAG: ComEC/Rec2 family competence protein [Acidimicrobiales bacterium]